VDKTYFGQIYFLIMKLYWYKIPKRPR
jgi:hypothetical protein